MLFYRELRRFSVSITILLAVTCAGCATIAVDKLVYRSNDKTPQPIAQPTGIPTQEAFDYKISELRANLDRCFPPDSDTWAIKDSAAALHDRQARRIERRNHAAFLGGTGGLVADVLVGGGLIYWGNSRSKEWDFALPGLAILIASAVGAPFACHAGSRLAARWFADPVVAPEHDVKLRALVDKYNSHRAKCTQSNPPPDSLKRHDTPR